MKTNLEHNMEEILNLPESEPIIESNGEIVVVEDNADADFEKARGNIHEIITKGQTALDDIITLARASDSPRAYEVVTQMIKTLVDANKDLIELRKKMKDVTEDKEKNSPTNIQNALFIGSTSELQKLINNRNTQ